jgi:small subunit ribosomal protein S2
MPYVNQRWLGGMLTNFQTVAGRVRKLQELESSKSAGDFDAMPKKEALQHQRELEKLERNLGGIRRLQRPPDAIFVIDTKKEHIAVTEANKLRMPVVAVVDTNCDPDVIDYVIPGNDDAIRAGRLMCRVIADAVAEGRFIASRRALVAAAPPAPAPAPAPAAAPVAPAPVAEAAPAPVAEAAPAPVAEAFPAPAATARAPVAEAAAAEVAAPVGEAAPVAEAAAAEVAAPVVETAGGSEGDADGGPAAAAERHTLTEG